MVWDTAIVLALVGAAVYVERRIARVEQAVARLNVHLGYIAQALDITLPDEET